MHQAAKSLLKKNKNDGEEGPDDGKEGSGTFNLKQWRKQRKQRQEEEELRRKGKKKRRKEKKLDADQEDFEEDDEDEKKPIEKKSKKEELDDDDSRSRSPAHSEKRPGGALMTEAEVLAMVKKNKKKIERGSEAVRARIAKENAEWEDMKKWKPMSAPDVNLTYLSNVKKDDGSQLRAAAQRHLSVNMSAML